MKRISQDTAQTIINEYISGVSATELHKRYSLTKANVLHIVTGRTWKSCYRPDNIASIVEQHKKLYVQVKNESLPELTIRQQEIITGSLLGDGSLSGSTGKINSKFRKKQCIQLRPYLDWHYAELSPFSKSIKNVHSDEVAIFNKNTNRVVRKKCKSRIIAAEYYTVAHPRFSALRSNWYPVDRKQLPSDLRLTPLTVAVWFLDDGCNDKQCKTAYFYTQSFAFEEAEHLANLMSEFNIRPKLISRTSKKTGVKQPVLRIPTSDYQTLIDLVQPYIECDCLRYKIEVQDVA